MWRSRFASPRVWLSAASLVLALSTGCSEPSTPSTPGVSEAPEAGLPVELDGAFVAVPRVVSAEQKQQAEQKLDGVVEDSGTSFYLAIRRSELGQKWFMSAYLKQNHPGGVLYNAAKSMGTRVVSFKEQNGKLFVLDVDERKAMSDVFDPDVVVEAYPIVTGHGPFNRSRGSDQYVLFDPTAGLNRFGVMGDTFSRRGVRFQVELIFAQRFRRLADGITFEQVFTGYLDVPDADAAELLEANPFRNSGTLALALRRYAESPGYTPTPLPPREHYFRGPARYIQNTLLTEQVAAKWNIHPGMKPIRWHITPSLITVQNDPRYQGYDLVGAVKRGIEGWNAAFGFKALEAVVDDDLSSFADDEKNTLIFDTDEAVPFAFANWRTNPNTGEIRGASVYLPALWVWWGDLVFGDDATAGVATLKTDRPLLLSWNGMGGDSLCELEPRGPQEAELEPWTPASRSAMAEATAPLTKKQKVEAYLTNVVLHEIGHTLGLRHNFMASRVYDGGPASPRATSVMDYLVDEDAVYLDTPGPYDVEAVRYLYGLSTQLPTLAFCTDEDTAVDPYCNPSDRFDDPLTKYYIPRFHERVDVWLRGTRPISQLLRSFDFYVKFPLQFVRAGNAQTRASAYLLTLAHVRPPLQVPAGAPATYAAQADEIAWRTLARLYLDPAASRGIFTANPPNSPELLPLVIADVRAILLNTDGIRSYTARRTMVDILKAQQTLASYATLREAQDTLTAQLPALSGDERLQSEDLIARISAAVSPYFR
ncbi:zinc-dependent metalloprotease [Myxococcus sp. RHSTA-1-4]|uniref:zinc-dependent metalloprotease n=1 Tax=Myxococcus sp. RHSTA-1-4 TaxID=2874601 RepID=UPI001CC0F342|nr:zinc-dependent metalloprotease [Myxococcus sp. RHSTA-1-4]MBZ4420837.1 zinc-dependent metalloprotease [Myxococcus sp. RHSTA-1-4]